MHTEPNYEQQRNRLPELRERIQMRVRPVIARISQLLQSLIFFLVTQFALVRAHVASAFAALQERLRHNIPIWQEWLHNRRQQTWAAIKSLASRTHQLYQQLMQQLALRLRLSERREAFASVMLGARHFVPYLKQQRWLLLGGLVALLLEVGLRLLEPWPLKLIVDYVITPQLAGAAATGPLSPAQQAGLAAAGLLAITGLRAFAAYCSTVAMALAGNRVLTELRADLYRHMQRLSLAYHTRTRPGDLLNRLTGDVGRLQEVAVTAALPLVSNVLTLVGMLIVMAFLNIGLTLIAIAIVPIFFFVLSRLGQNIHSVARAERKREGVLAASAAESLGAIRVVQALSLERITERAFTRQNNKSLNEGAKGKRLAARLERTVDVLVALGTALVLWYGTLQVLSHELLLGDLLVFTTYLKNAFRPMRDLAKYSGRIAKAGASAERIIDVLDTTPDVRDMPWSRPAPKLNGEVVFEQVSFAYQLGHYVLRDVNLRVQPGERIALVGPSGGGKSTLVSLLLRLYDPTRGEVLFDGKNIRHLTLDTFRPQTATVLQESILFAASVRDNIAYGAPEATDAQIRAAAELANAHDFIERMPQGYDTMLGERGATISGGQRQRIAITRAALRQAAIVILDEPTSGLDKASEQSVSEALDRLTQGRTTFIVAHNLHTISHVDRILYIEQGRIAEQGTHSELLALGGKYAALYELQENPHAANR